MVSTSFIVVTKYWIFISFPLLFGFLTWKILYFELAIVSHVIESHLGLFSWYSIVDDNLLLGAVPLEELHADELTKFGIQAVITILEPYETEINTLWGKPLSTQFWKENGIEHIIIPSKDLVPLSFEDLDYGCKVLDTYLSNNKRIYCHCKSGLGRSASLIVAYNFKYKGVSISKAYQRVQRRRPIIFSQVSNHYKNLERYSELLRPVR